jgi:uncharacterized protein YdeI (BOF family)
MTDEPKDAFRRVDTKQSTLKLALAAIGLIVVGGAAGTVAGHVMQPAIEMAPLRPVAIKSLASSSSIITLRGRVAEIYGDKFVIDDGSGRALVETGPEGEGGNLVGVGAPVSVQGRFDRGVVHASFLVDQAGKVTALGPVGGPPHDRPAPPPPPHRGDAPPPPPPGGDGPPPAPPAAPPVVPIAG